MVQNKVIQGIIYSLTTLKEIDYRFFNRLGVVNLFKDPKKNYFSIRGLKTMFFFGDSLSISRLVKVSVLIDSLNNKIIFNKVDLRFSDIIVSY